jgi:hypothetical protein
VIHGDSPGDPRRSAGRFGRKGVAKIVSGTEGMKSAPIAYMSVLKLCLLAEVQQKV